MSTKMPNILMHEIIAPFGKVTKQKNLLMRAHQMR